MARLPPPQPSPARCTRKGGRESAAQLRASLPLRERGKDRMGANVRAMSDLFALKVVPLGSVLVFPVLSPICLLATAARTSIWNRRIKLRCGKL